MKSKVLSLFEEFPDDVRHPLIVENDDWEERLTPALLELASLKGKGLDSETFYKTLRIIIETSYVMGYQRGQNEKSL